MLKTPITLAAVLLASAACAQGVDQGPKNTDFAPAWDTQTRAPAQSSGVTFAVQELATGLDTPWAVEPLPGGGYILTERAGALRLVQDGALGDPIAGLPDLVTERQGGLLDVALSPDFAQNREIYLSYSKPMSGGKSATAAARATLSADGTRLEGLTDIFVQDPPSPTPMHFGGRMVLQDGFLFLTTGEHSSRADRGKAQEVDKTYGKVVRIRPDGTVPDDNPFDNAVWTLGHRNPQGIDISPDGTLWTLEHGPRGGDELNVIVAGENYGWPVVSYGINYGGSPIGSGEPRAEGFKEPQYYWDPVIAPGGFSFYDGEMFADWQGDVLAASLNPGGLVRLDMDGERVVGEERFFDGEFRVWDVKVDLDGAILILDSSNGRLLRLTPDTSG
ncbi:PQQ-dependent sugar dehydrogenase [Sulfitobacter albidus]|uniref:PQQ-dependent sugar dehydrogenase n=1 Tax=Sulfitobacter albidus TaxID=2829501 RepID=A0A975JEP5_9RHOB|nr:PQQ-dependent sugar dehydrogenase [Sulfitobacter albidus]QUJ77078.1 PQQ-dependent sugar dehydrogenase [Sulfitobacter albidus]